AAADGYRNIAVDPDGYDCPITLAADGPDMPDLDDMGAMDPKEPFGIQAALQLGDRQVAEILPHPVMQVRVTPVRPDGADGDWIEQHGRAVALGRDAHLPAGCFSVARGRWRPYAS